MKIFDIYCDASVNSNLRGACAGALITERQSLQTNIRAVIQPEGTNNSGEICAILLGVMIAIDIRQSTPEPCRFNIFSDSIVGIRGVREWIFHWINNANKIGTNTLVNSSGDPVANQLYFKLIFNHIVLHGIPVHFYHQYGHVKGNYNMAARHFTETNGINLLHLGLTVEKISAFNNLVDSTTRDILRNYMAGTNPVIDGVVFDIIANTMYERISDNMAIPVVKVLENPPTDREQQDFASINGNDVIRRYANLIYATEYPSKSRIAKYL